MNGVEVSVGTIPVEVDPVNGCRCWRDSGLRVLTVRGDKAAVAPYLDAILSVPGQMTVEQIPGQMTVADALVATPLPAQEDRCRDEPAETSTN